MDAKVIVGNTALVCTIASFLTGVQICLKIWKKRCTADISAFPFIAGVLCTSQWLSYGIYISDQTVILVNSFGLICQAAYLMWYCVFALNKAEIGKQILLLAVVLTSILYYLLWKTTSTEEAARTAGLLACAASLLFCGSPLATVADVIKTKSVESLPFPLILSSFFVTSLWYIYGILVGDSFIQVPNFIGALISGFQLMLFVVYSGSPKKSHVVIS